MRLRVLEHGHSPEGKATLASIRQLLGAEPPDITRLMFYRPALLCGPLNERKHRALRGESMWSVAERELFAALVARLNHCDT